MEADDLVVTWTNQGRTLHAPLAMDSTIGQLKEWLAATMNTKREGIRLSVGDIDLTKEEQRTIGYYRVRRSDPWLVHSLVEVTVHHDEVDKEPAKLMLDVDTTYESMLRDLKWTAGLDVERHHLVTKDGQVVPDVPHGKPLRSFQAQVELFLKPDPDILALTVTHPPGTRFKDQERSGLGYQTVLMIKKHQTIRGVIEELSSRKEIPKENIRLRLHGDTVHAGQSLSELGILADGATLDLEVIPDQAGSTLKLSEPLVVILSLPRNKLRIEVVDRNDLLANLPGWATFHKVRLIWRDISNFLDGSKSWAEYGFPSGIWLKVIPDPEVEFMIFTRTLAGKTLGLEVFAQDDVSEVNRIIFEKEGIPPEEQRLLFGGMQLSQGRTLASYGIRADATLLLTTRLRGGGVKFVDMSSGSSLRKHQWATGNVPRWRMVEAGLSVEGVCSNSSCPAHGHTVIVNKRFQAFDLIVEAQSGCLCPVCGKTVIPRTCGFNNCWWKWNGVKQTRDGEEEECGQDWARADDAYHRFTEDAGMAEWKRLLIYVKPLSDDPRGGKPNERFCSICITDITVEEEAAMARLECGHAYHQECIDGWLIRSSTCPYCRHKISQ